jgi:capsular polysaccharide biosynthesis protein
VTSRARPSRRPIARLAATLLAPLLSPVTVFRACGILPYRAASAVPRILHAEPEAPAFTEPAPASAGGASAWSASRSLRVPRAQVACVPEGIAVASGAVFDHRGRFIDSASHDHDFADNPRRRKRGFAPRPSRRFPAIRRFRHDVVVLAASNQRFYFHWLFDVLPRLWLAEQAGHAAGPFYVESVLPFQQQTLEILGVTADRRIDPGETGAISAFNLVVPCHAIVPGRVFPEWSIRFLRDRLLPAAGEAQESAPRRLYISRGNAGHRRVLNEPDVDSFLAGYGFQSVRAEALGFREQAALFRDAEIVVAPHGGGLSNLVFCAPGTTVIELFPPVNIDLYHRLATRLKLDYSFLKSSDSQRAFMGPEHYRIGLRELGTVLDRALAGRSDESGQARR